MLLNTGEWVILRLGVPFMFILFRSPDYPKEPNLELSIKKFEAFICNFLSESTKKFTLGSYSFFTTRGTLNSFLSLGTTNVPFYFKLPPNRNCEIRCDVLWGACLGTRSVSHPMIGLNYWNCGTIPEKRLGTRLLLLVLFWTWPILAYGSLKSSKY